MLIMQVIISFPVPQDAPMSPSPATDSGSPLPGTVPDSAQDEQRKELSHAKTVNSIGN